MIICKRCSCEGESYDNRPDLCVACAKAENNRYSYIRRHNYDWIEAAAEAGIELWERQPGETDREYEIWLTYRDAYPGIKPSYSGAATQLMTTYNVVSKVSNRWSFQARMQAWAKHCDEITLRQRETEILAMNDRHIRMSSVLSSKLELAINKISPESLDTEDIARLFKLSTEIERKARLDQLPVGVGSLTQDEENPEIKKNTVKQESMADIVKILAAAGQFDMIGVKQTVTTEVVVKNEDV